MRVLPAEVKLPLYARAGIPEAWVVDLRHRKIEDSSDPASGSYQTSRTVGSGEQLRSESVESLALSIDEVLE